MSSQHSHDRGLLSTECSCNITKSGNKGRMPLCIYLVLFIWIFQIANYSCLLIFLWCGVLSVSQWSVKTFISHFLCRLIKDHSKVARWIERKYSSATWNLLCYFPQKLLNKNLLKLRLKTWTGGIVSNRAVNESSQSFSFYLEKAATRTTSLFKVPLQLMTKK